MRQGLAEGAAIVVFRPTEARHMVGSCRKPRAAHPRGSDANPAERAIGLCNGGLMASPARRRWRSWSGIGNDNRRANI
jgi:hypothetical protein